MFVQSVSQSVSQSQRSGSSRVVNVSAMNDVLHFISCVDGRGSMLAREASQPSIKICLVMSAREGSAVIAYCMLAVGMVCYRANRGAIHGERYPGWRCKSLLPQGFHKDCRQLGTSVSILLCREFSVSMLLQGTFLEFFP